MSINFIILSTQRSGTTWVIEMLNSHPNVVAYGELFVADGQGKPRRGAQDCLFWETHYACLSEEERQHGLRLLITRYLDGLFSPGHEVEAVGFKLMYGQAGAYPAVADYTRRHRVSVLHLIRRNVLDIVLSKNAAATRGMFSANEGQEVPPVRLRLNARKLVQRLEHQERQVQRGRRLFRDAGVPFLEVFYEDLIASPTSFADLLAFLGVREPATQLATPMVKLNTEPHHAMIENYDEVRQALSGTRFDHLLR